MFESFRNFVTEFVDGGKHPSQFADNDYRLAATALLVHAAAIDGDMSKRERDTLRAVVKRRFALDDARALYRADPRADQVAAPPSGVRRGRVLLIHIRRAKKAALRKPAPPATPPRSLWPRPAR